MLEPVHVISLGAGVQSSCVALMAALGEITPMPTAAVFADTQGEPSSVYRWLNWLESQLPFPVHRVTRGSLADRALEMRVSARGFLFTKTDIPVYTRNTDGTIGKVRHRACTRDFKIVPITRKVREIAKIKRGQKEVGAVQWIGISLDEISRMKDHREPWARNRWPLIELRMTRHDCLMWMQAHGFPRPPRSSCVYCPFHTVREWRRLRDEEPGEFERAVQFERNLQRAKARTGNFSSMPFLHRSCVPLDEVDFSQPEDHGQTVLHGILNECDGVCGV